ncbi:MAG: hypothetical protein DRP10_00090 [Candidatus Aenigmatarchaeota archaeon]|nr:MAG: hypothetical protein DRP10_00090 [Candidatus Aenigmarchaeota archaeon]
MKKDEILRILIDWNFWGNYKDESIERKEYLKKLKSLMKTGEIVVVKGVRRAGKSFFSLHALKEKNSGMLISMRKKFAMLNLMKLLAFWCDF